VVVPLGADANAATDAALAESCVDTVSTASLLRHQVVSRKTSHRSGREAIQPRIEAPVQAPTAQLWSEMALGTVNSSARTMEGDVSLW